MSDLGTRYLPNAPIGSYLAALVLLSGVVGARPQVNFVVGQELPNAGGVPFSVRETAAADLDGDGDIDVVHGRPDEIVWYENLDHQGSFGAEQILATQPENLNSLATGDFNGDGDVDVFAGGFESGLAWFENLDGLGGFSVAHLFGAPDAKVRRAVVADMDGDGDLDVAHLDRDDASGNSTKLRWKRNDGAGNFSEGGLVASSLDDARVLNAADLDLDGDLDLLTDSASVNQLYLYENLDGLGSFSLHAQWVPIMAEDVSIADLDGDGDPDLIVNADPGLAWYSNDQAGQFLLEAEFDTLDHYFAPFVADLDEDGDLDIVSSGGEAGEWSVYLYENLDGAGAFASGVVLDDDALATGVASDLDGDGDLDLLGSSWYPNLGNLNFGNYNLFYVPTKGAIGVAAADFDGDGDQDIAVAERDSDLVAWAENTDGAGHFGGLRVVSTNVGNASSLFAADLNSDGDPDLLSSSEFHDKVAWYENVDGAGGFSDEILISTSLEHAAFAVAGDADGDGDIDVFAASDTKDRVVWFENLDALGGFGPELLIDDDADFAQWLKLADVDGDGSLDVLCASGKDDTIGWYRNLDGLGDFGARLVINDQMNAAEAVEALDLDGDGDLDVVGTGQGDSGAGFSGLGWHRNLDGAGAFGAELPVDGGFHSQIRSVRGGDFDLDGDIDLCLGAFSFSSSLLRGVFQVENVDFAASFPPVSFVYAADSHDLTVVDIDGDGDSDLLVPDRNGNPDDPDLAWVENTLLCSDGPAEEFVRLGVPPNPAALLPGLTQGPVIGNVWDPAVDHTLFGPPAALLDFLLVATGPANLPTPNGTFLVNLGTLLFVAGATPPGMPFQLPVPDDCSFVGTTLVVQGGSADASSAYLLTNALDVKIGASD